MTARYTAVSGPIYLLDTDTGQNKLDSLSDGTNSQTTNTEGITFSNDQVDERHIFGDFFISLGQQENPRRIGAFVSLFLVPITVSAVGVRSEPSVQVPEMLNNYYVGSFSLDDSYMPRFGFIGAVRLPPMDFFPVVRNETGQRFASTGNILTVYTYGYEDIVS